MPRRGDVVPRPLLNFRCGFAIEASHVGADKLDDLVTVIESDVLGGVKVDGKGSSNHPDFPQTVYVEISQDRIDAFDLMSASRRFSRRIGMDNRAERGFNHLFNVVAESEVDNVLPRPFANVQGINEQIDFEMSFSNVTKEQVNRSLLTASAKLNTIRDYNIKTEQGTGRVRVSGTTGQGIISVNSIQEILDTVEEGEVIAESFNITCTVTEIVRV